MPDQIEPSDDREQGSLDYIKAALTWQYNLIGLAGAGVFSLASHSPLPMLLAAGVELMYLATVPQMGAFRRLVRSWRFADQKRRNQMRLHQMFMELPPEMRNRYVDLDRTVRTIRANYQRLSSTSQIFMGQIEDKLQGLCQSYLRLLHSAHAHRMYLKTTDVDTIRREVRQIEEGLEHESPKVQEINRKRIEILNKRIEKYDKIRENCDVVDAQCAAIEDVLQLVRDQSVTMRDPQQITVHLDSLMQDVEQTEETVREVESIYELTTPEMAAAGPALMPSPTGPPSTSPQPRSRVRS